MINVRDTLKNHGLRANKRYGQNFLTDARVLAKIAECGGVGGDDVVIEIGAGLGSLTAELAKRAKRVLAYEIDGALLPALNENAGGFCNVTIINADALKADFVKDLTSVGAEGCCFCANLPYYITTPLLFKMFESGLAAGRSITVMTQREVADRLCAKAGGGDYSAVTVTAGFYGRVEKVCNVPANCFVPRPEVDSAVVKFTVYKPDERICPPGLDETFFKTVKAAFAHRRKTLVNCLVSAGLCGGKDEAAEALAGLGLVADVRGEMLTLENFAELAGRLRVCERVEICPLNADNLPEYANVIREAFATVARDFGWTRETAPTHSAYVTDERLAEKIRDGYCAFGLCGGGKIIGFVSLTDKGAGVYELNHLAVLPERRHCGYGKRLLDFCKDTVRERGGKKISLSFVEENETLKEWYAVNGFVHTGTNKYDWQPFTAGFMEWES